MKRVVPDTAAMRTEASAWIAQLETGDLDAADIEAFREWIARNPLHAAEMKRLARLSDELNVLTELASPLEQASARYQPVIRRPTFAQLRSSVAAITTVLVAALITWSVLQLPTDPPVQVVSQSFLTNVGEYDEHLLSDGSRIAMNTGSRLDIDFNDQRRQVVLHEGEALFTVTADPSRPFIVTAGTSQVTAIGTAFVVRYLEDEVEVAVTHGRVSLSTTEVDDTRTEPMVAIEERNPLVLAKGQSITVVNRDSDEAAAIRNVTERELRRKLAWREGLLEFEQTPLSQVVREISRHSGMNIVIMDTALQDRSFGGLFRVGETGKLLEVLDTRDDIEVRYVDDKTVLLASRETSD